MKDRNNKKLIFRDKKGNVVSWAETSEGYGKGMKGFFTVVVPDAEAEEVDQETFEKEKKKLKT